MRILETQRIVFRVIAVVALIHLGPTFAWSASTQESPSEKPTNCLGSMCVRSDPWFESFVIRQYTKGFVQEKRIGKDLDSRSHCYYDPEQKLWVRLEADFHSNWRSGEIASILVTKEPICEKSYRPRKPFPEFRTWRGISVGSSEAHVLSRHGQPVWRRDARRDEVKLGSHVLAYSPEGNDSLLGLFVFIRDGKVYSIELFDSE